MHALSTIPVFYRSDMAAPRQGYSPSAAKPGQAVASWEAKRLPIDIRAPRAASRAELILAHNAAYVDDVLALRQANGFGTRDARVAHSLRFTSGAMVAAGREAIKNRLVACAPVSGFHHAGHDFGGGFCTFNGLMVAANVLRHEGRARRVGILDLDQHYGNGTDDIIRTQGAQKWVKHYTGGQHLHRRSEAKLFLAELPQIMASFAGCDVLLYQAGADPHVNDPLGGWLTTKQLQVRDRIVFECAKEMRLPVAWNLAGGYQDPFEKVLEIHDNTMKECAQVYLAHNVLRIAA